MSRLQSPPSSVINDMLQYLVYYELLTAHLFCQHCQSIMETQLREAFKCLYMVLTCSH
ncbi:hypothetical protein BDR03DRAFT_976107 [Suillus americanus]|nr:hypothetical protein BDR03DRAFT_976107 [Suillus americanus]